MENKKKRKRINPNAICSSEQYQKSKKVHASYKERRHEELLKEHEKFLESSLHQEIQKRAASEPQMNDYERFKGKKHHPIGLTYSLWGGKERFVSYYDVLYQDVILGKLNYHLVW